MRGWAAEARHMQQVSPDVWHDGVSCGDGGWGPRGLWSGGGGAHGCPGGAPHLPQAGRGPDVRREGLRPVGQDVGLCLVAEAGCPGGIWWHLLSVACPRPIGSITF